MWRGQRGHALAADPAMPADDLEQTLATPEDEQRHSALLEKVRACPNLPSLPAVAMQVLEVTKNRDFHVADLAKLIQRDPALAGKVLRTVNSAMYATREKISTIDRAVVVLGREALKTLALGFSLVTDLKKAGADAAGFDHVLFWKRSVYSAAAAQLLCEELDEGDAGPVPEEALLATLLRDIGMLVLDQTLREEYAEALGGAVRSEDILTSETRHLGTNHAMIGAEIARDWQLPDPIVECVRRHHHTGGKGMDADTARLCSVVQVADRFGETFVLGEDNKAAVVEARRAAKSLLDIPARRTDELLTNVLGNAKEVAKLFEIDLKEPHQVQAILNQANEQLVTQSLQSQAESTAAQQAAAEVQAQAEAVKAEAAELEQQAAELRRAATTDRLTGMLNRGAFDEKVAEELKKAETNQSPLALVLVDLDHFKGVNDKHGHLAGDAVLRLAGKLLLGVAREGEYAFRYGGEEMALLLPGATESEAVRRGEVFRHAMARAIIKHEAKQLRVTASLGVSVFDASPSGRVLNKPPLLIRAADMALYNAKGTGRNRTKVFQLPKSGAA